MASDFELQVMAELSTIKSLATKAVAASEAAQSSAEAATAALTERLFNHGSGVIATLQADIQEMKAEKIRDDRWEKVHNILHYSLTPIVVAAHAIAKHFGADI
jgi:hypothetical protein